MPRAEFTEKEKKIIKLSAQALSVTKIAEEIGVSKADVCQTLRRIANKIKEIDDSVALMKEMGVLKETATIELTKQGQDFLEKIKGQKKTDKMKNEPDHKLPKLMLLEVKNYYREPRDQGFKGALKIPTEGPKIIYPEEQKEESINYPINELDPRKRITDLQKNALMIQQPSIEEGLLRSCPQCGSSQLMYDFNCAEIICTDCGFVMQQKIADRGPEWRAFDDEQSSKRTRVGAPLTYAIHDKGLSKTIDWHDRDINGKSLSPGQKAQVYRLRKHQRRIRVSDATERNLAFALSEITRISTNLNLPNNILETASVIYRKAVKERLIRGRSIQGVTSATLYLACRQCGLPRTLDEIAQASTVNKKEVGKSYRFLIRELNYSIPPLRPSQYITKFSNQLTMQGKVEEIAHKILAAAKELKLTSGRDPTGIAAAASYVASILTGERKTEKEIADIAQVSEATMKLRCKELIELLMFQLSI